MPSHHLYPETLISFAAGTLPGAVACVAACHLSMCVECAKQIRWLEQLGGVLLSNLETTQMEPPLDERLAAQSSVQPQSYERNHEQVTEFDSSLLPLPLVRYLGANVVEIARNLMESGNQEHSIELPHDSGSIKLLRLSPGQRLPKYNLPLETEVALVLDGVCHDGVRTYVRGDIIEWAEDSPHRPMVSEEAKCICLMAARPLGRHFDLQQVDTVTG